MEIENAADIQKLFHPRYLVPDAQKNILIEHNKTTDGVEFESKVELYHCDSYLDYVTYRFEDKSCNDQLPELFPYFEHKMGLRKNCDYIVFVCDKSKFYFLLFELKLYNSSNKPQDQLISSSIFVDFVLKRILDAGHTFMFPVEVRMIGIRDPQLMKMRNKKFTKTRDYKYNDRYLELCGDGKTTRILVNLIHC